MFRIPIVDWSSEKIPSLHGVTKEVSSRSKTATFVGEMEKVLNKIGEELKKIGKSDFAELVSLIILKYYIQLLKK